MAPIGGVLARVTPKLRGKVELDQKVQEDEDIVIVHGKVDPKVRCQSLRVDMIAPDGSVLYVLTDTNDRGRFIARFTRPAADKVAAKMLAADKFTEHIVAMDRAHTAFGADQRTNCPVDRNEPPKKGDDIDNGKQEQSPTYAFQAHIINASKIAPTDSNIIYWKRR